MRQIFVAMLAFLLSGSIHAADHRFRGCPERDAPQNLTIESESFRFDPPASVKLECFGRDVARMDLYFSNGLERNGKLVAYYRPYLGQLVIVGSYVASSSDQAKIGVATYELSRNASNARIAGVPLFREFSAPLVVSDEASPRYEFSFKPSEVRHLASVDPQSPLSSQIGERDETIVFDCAPVAMAKHDLRLIKLFLAENRYRRIKEEMAWQRIFEFYGEPVPPISTRDTVTQD